MNLSPLTPTEVEALEKESERVVKACELVGGACEFTRQNRLMHLQLIAYGREQTAAARREAYAEVAADLKTRAVYEELFAAFGLHSVTPEQAETASNILLHLAADYEARGRKLEPRLVKQIQVDGAAPLRFFAGPSLAEAKGD